MPQCVVTIVLASFFCAVSCDVAVVAHDYPYAPFNEGKMEPQQTGWPLTDAEREYILKPEHDRRPGREANKYLPAMWPVVPSAGHWGGTSWLDTHAKLVDYVKANQGRIDILLVGDSITQQWGSPLDKGVFNDAWKNHFGGYKTLNIGIGGDKAQNVLWRLDHGGVEGLEPRLVVLMIGNNNMFFTPETGIQSAAKGVQICVANLREKFPQAHIIVAKILPCHAPGSRFYEDIKLTNAAIDELKLSTDPKVTVLDLTNDFLNTDGTILKSRYTPDKIHLSLDGYAIYAERLKPFVEESLGGKGLGSAVIIPAGKATASALTSSMPLTNTRKPATAANMSAEMFIPTLKTEDGKRLVYPYAPYNDGKMDPQLTGWPLTDEEKNFVTKGEYFRKPGHEVQKHLPEMWFVTPTAAHWSPGDGSDGNEWIRHHATCIKRLQAAKDGIDITLLGDSITQGWGGGWDGLPFNAAWQERFGGYKTVNLGIGGDRIENILWRLDHGALEGVSPKVIVLMIGVNNAPLVHANGVPATTAAHGIKLCVENLRLRCPTSQIVVVKLQPAFDPSMEAGASVREINSALDAMKLERDSQVQLLDLWADFTNTDGTLRTDLYSDGHLHLSPAGYKVLASRLEPMIKPKIM